jgi:hypothetical protein
LLCQKEPSNGARKKEDKKMTKNNLIVPGIIIIALLMIVSIVAAVSYFGVSGDSPIDKDNPHFWHECTVVVDSPLFSAAEIKDANCVNTQKNCGSVLGQLGLFSIMGDQGRVEMWDSNGKLTSKRYETNAIGRTDTVTLSGCSAESSFTLRLYDDGGNLLEQQGG